MHRYELLAGQFPDTVLENYDAASQRFKARADRFSQKVLTNYAATAIPKAFTFRAATADAPVEILLYDEIGYWGVTASAFVKALAQAGDGPLTLRINSPGGDVFDGYAIYNALKARSAPVNVVVDGIAASAASFIAMAGASVKMAETSMMMIHNSQGICFGDRNDMSEMVDIMGKIDGQIAAIYAGKAGGDASTFATAMDAETWYTSAEAKAASLCDEVSAPVADPGPIDPVSTNRGVRKLWAAVQPYDPDGDGDNDAQAAIDLIQTAIGTLSDAIEALNGTEPDPAATDPEPDTTAESTLQIEAMRRRLRLAEALAA